MGGRPLAVYRHHPRRFGQSWIDPAFFEKCRRHGYGAPVAAMG